MVKSLVKPLIINEKNLINYTSNTPKEYNSPKKSRQEINRENYQKNKERIKKRQQERYQNIRMEAIKGTTESEKKYSDASDIKILMSLKKIYWIKSSKKRKLIKVYLNFQRFSR